MNYNNREYESKEDRIYKYIHRLNEEGYSIDDICERIKTLPRWKTIDIIQKIEGRKYAAKERRGVRV